MQLLAYVDPANQLSIHVDLRVGRPIRVLLEALTDLFILVDIEVAVVTDDGSVLVEQCDYLLAESALRSLGRALHEKHHFGLIHQLLQPLFQSLYH